VFAAYQVDAAALKRILAAAPLERTPIARDTPTVLTVPMPDGRFERFRIQESPIMKPGLAARLPGIRTYQGQGLDDPSATGRFDWTPFGFHGMVLSEAGTVYVDPYARGDVTRYISYYKRDLQKPGAGFVCLTGGSPRSVVPGVDDRIVPRVSNGGTERYYDLAAAATGEYTAFYGGTEEGGLAGITTTMNRVNAIYQRELSVRINLIDGIAFEYTNAATDPYTNDDPVAMLEENQANLDELLPEEWQYDIGHVFSTASAGAATRSSVCNLATKAHGVSGSANPIGDPFDVDMVAHQMGHQFGGDHTFNGTTGDCGGNRDGGAAFEPGSGATVLSYAGACGGQNLQSHRSDYFHVKSLEQMVGFIMGAGACADEFPGVSPPTVNAGPDYTIPRGTPFVLTATVSDPGTSIYAWEEYDLGPPSPPDSDTDSTERPIFRSYPPTTSPSRTFPHAVYVLNHANIAPATYSGASPTGIGGIACEGGSCLTAEVLPSIARTMMFQVTARESAGEMGAIGSDGMTLTVADSGPFTVTAPNTAVTWPALSIQTVSWDVNGTNEAPVNAGNVAILLSVDGGVTFPVTLSAVTPNDGIETIAVPNVSTAAARILVAGSGNIFFDVSDENFTITAAPVTGTITIVEDTVPDGPQDFAFTTTGGLNPSTFSLDDDADGTLSDSLTFMGLLGGYTVTEGAVGGFALTGLTCVDPDGGSTTNLGTRTATIDVDAGEAVTCTFTNEPQATHTVRDLLPCYIAGAANQVGIDVTPPAGTLAYAVEDQPPAGWTVSNISDGGVFDGTTGRVKWGPFFDANSRMLTYDVTPPAGTTGPVNWTGLASFDGVNEELGGDVAIAEPCGFPPDYNPGDLRITVGEVTGYGACWRGGSCTGIPVVPALIAYVTRAGFLWRSGEVFHRDPACDDTYPDDAQCWVPGAGRQVTLRGGAWAPSRRPGGTATLAPLSLRPNGRSFEVTILLTPNRGTLAQAVEQRVPAGARVTRISDGGVYDAATRSVKWGPLLDDTPRTLTYRLTVPRGTTPSPRLVGRASFDGVVVRIR
jgi:hypothetical protein